MAAKIPESNAAQAALEHHQAPHDPHGQGDEAMEEDQLSQLESQSYANIASNVKKLELHLTREDKSNDYTTTYKEISDLVFKRLLLPEGKLVSVDSTPFKKIIIEVDGSVDFGELNLTQALEVRKGLKTRPLQSPDTDREVRINRAPMNMDNAEIAKVLGLFGDITSGIRHVMLESEGAEPGSWQFLMKGVKTAERTLRMKIKVNIPSYIMVLGQKLKCDYPGQPKTCPRCHRYWSTCPGSGKVDKCKKAGQEEKDIKVTFKQLVNRLKKKGAVPDVETSAPLVAKRIPNPDQITFSGLPDDMNMDGFCEWLDSNGVTFLASMCFKGSKPGTFVITSYEEDGEVIQLDAKEAEQLVTKLHGVELNKKRVLVQMEQLSTPTKVTHAKRLKIPAESPETSQEVINLSSDDSGHQPNSKAKDSEKEKGENSGGGVVVKSKKEQKRENKAKAKADARAEAKRKAEAEAQAKKADEAKKAEENKTTPKNTKGSLKLTISTAHTQGGSQVGKVVLGGGGEKRQALSSPGLDSSTSSSEGGSPKLTSRTEDGTSKSVTESDGSPKKSPWQKSGPGSGKSKNKNKKSKISKF